MALIHSSVKVMTTHSYISANIESILKKAGVSKNYFYHHFKNLAKIILKAD
ncbi:TetR family transcriptional regulator [Snodgrassella alvi]|uniref:TetR family transcriptional regulator n=1 Tax=Snodgrassella alvi TaxID=1196083 RepID=UPI0035A373D2